jgi:hypothetical protein
MINQTDGIKDQPKIETKTDKRKGKRPAGRDGTERDGRRDVKQDKTRKRRQRQDTQEKPLLSSTLLKRPSMQMKRRARVLSKVMVKCLTPSD